MIIANVEKLKKSMEKIVNVQLSASDFIHDLGIISIILYQIKIYYIYLLSFNNMKFTWKDVTLKILSDKIRAFEYCEKIKNLPIDAAIIKIDDQLGPKINKQFAELFFVLSGQLIIWEQNNQHVLNKLDMFIMYPQITHIILGKKCTLFVSCAPQFNPENVEFIN